MKKVRHGNRLLALTLTLALLSPMLPATPVLAAKEAPSSTKAMAPSVPDVPDEAFGEVTNLALKSGTLTAGTSGTKPVIRTEGFIDKFEESGKGAAVSVKPDIEQDGYYRVSLEYAKGPSKATGYISLYQNGEKIGQFNTKESGLTTFVLSEDQFLIKLHPQDQLSLRVDFDDTDEAIGRFKALKLERWGGKSEAENGTLIHPEGNPSVPVSIDHDKASGGKMVEGFVTGTAANSEKNIGAGVSFDIVSAPEDDTYQLSLGYMRSGDYEFEVIPSIYVNDSFVQNVDLSATENVDTFYETNPIELSLKKGDVISVRIGDSDKVNAYFALDYITLEPKAEEPAPDPADQVHFESDHVKVLIGNTFQIPLVNQPENTTITYQSKDEAIAAVDDTGLITAVSAGETTITAQCDAYTFTTQVTVVETQEELTTDQIALEAENGELVAGESGSLRVVSNKAYSGGKYVEDFNIAGIGGGVRFSDPVQNAGQYRIWLDYNKGSQNSGCTISLFVNDERIGKYTFYDTKNNFAYTVESNKLTASIKPGDTITIKRDTDDTNTLFRMDDLKLERITTLPAENIELNDLNMLVSERQNAALTTAPEAANDTLNWESSDPNIVRVENGVLTGIAPGTATITAASRYFEDLKDSCTVTVSQNDSLISLSNEIIGVTLDKTFPRVVSYKMMESGNTLDGNYYTLNKITINGKDYELEPDNVTFKKVDDSIATYELKISELNAVIYMSAKTDSNTFKLDITNIKEDGTDENRIFTIDIPGLNIVTVGSETAGSQFAGAIINNDVTKSGDTIIDLSSVKNADEISMEYAYAFLSNGNISAGVSSNALGNDKSITGSGGTTHLLKQTTAEGNSFRTGLSSRAWVYRRSNYTKLFQDLSDTYPDEQYTDDKGNEKMVKKTYTSEPEEQKPFIYVSLAEDENQNGKVDWQDGAVGYRPIMNHVFQEEKVRDLVVQRLVMQQANSGNYPYLTMLDETKRVSLNTDNLGQMILDKYHNEGYWGDLEHYDEHLGGWKDFKYMVDEATEKYNGYVGVHANFYEYFAKLSYFSPELTSMKADGITPNNKGYKAYGAFLTQCYNIDNIADALSGNRRQRLTTFKDDVPNLGFVYNDVWYNTGWDGRRIGEDYRSAGIGYFVEWPYVNFEDAMWSHWAVESTYGGATNKGINSDIMRFIWNDTRDRWDNINKEDYDGRSCNSRNLLIGADTTYYEGWPQAMNNKYQDAVNKIYEVNLPTKFMQHFKILQMDKDTNGWAKYIKFTDGVEAQYTGDDPWNREILINGKSVYKDHSYLLPWDDGEVGGETNLATNPIKFYHWSDQGGDSTWELPVDWTGTLYLYKLTDQGKTDEVTVPVKDGKITLTGIEAKTPYALYQDAQKTGNDDVTYGEGGYVSDPGFNSGNLNAWNLEKGQAAVKKNYYEGDDTTYVVDKYKSQLRNYELIMENKDETEVNQTIQGLTPGESYAVTAMVEIQQGHKRKTTLAVDCGDKITENYVDESTLVDGDLYDSKANTYMLRIRTEFTVPEGVEEAKIRLCTEADSSETPAIVRWDNVRLYDCTIKSEKSYAPATHSDGTEVTGKVISYQDYENTARDSKLVTNDKGLDQLKTEFEVAYPLVVGQGQLGDNLAAREARNMLVTRHDPYTQNGLEGSQWDPNTTDVDDAIDGDRTLRIYAAPLGISYQTIPQTVRFEAGHTYKVSFLYQYRKEREGTFEFVVGEGQIPREESHNITVSNIKQNAVIAATSPATSEAERIGKFTYEFTAASDNTWIGINRVKYIDVTEDPCPFQLDNLLIEDVDGGEEKLPQDAPKDLIASAPSKFGAADGKISGITKEMEYRSDNETAYTACDGNEITGLSAGKYYVRYAETKTHQASPDTKVTVPDGVVTDTQYKVSLDADQSVAFGSEAKIDVKVGSDTGKKNFNAIDLTLKYDSEKLQYVSISDTENYNVDAEIPGSLHIYGYGEDKALGTALSVTFKSIAMTDGTKVTIEAAKVDEAANASTADAPDAIVTGTDPTIVVSGYQVKLGEYLEGSSIAKPNADYSFTARDSENYDYKITATVDGVDISDNVVLGDHENYIIPAEYVIGSIEVSAVRTGKSYDVIFEGSGSEDVSEAAATANYGTDYSFVLNQMDGYCYKVNITVGGKALGSYTIEGNRYRIPGTSITGNLVITIEKAALEAKEVNVTFEGNGAGDVKGEPKAIKNKDYTFTLNKAEGYQYEINGKRGDTSVDVTDNKDGSYTVKAKDVTADIIITITKVQTAKVEVHEYVKLDKTSMFLVLVKGDKLDEGKVYQYDGNSMYWSDSYKAYAYLVITDAGFTEDIAAEKLSIGNGSASAIEYTGDVNETNLTDINDAQFVYDMYNGKYKCFDEVSVVKYLKADMNNDFTINVKDAAAIIDLILA